MSEPGTRTSLIPRRRTSMPGPAAEVPWPFEERRSRRSMEPPMPTPAAQIAAPEAETGDLDTGDLGADRSAPRWSTPDLDEPFSPFKTVRGVGPTPLPPPPEPEPEPVAYAEPAVSEISVVVDIEVEAQERPSVATLSFGAIEPTPMIEASMAPAIAPFEPVQTSAFAAFPAMVASHEVVSHEPVPAIALAEPQPSMRSLPRPANAERLTDADAIADDGLEISLLWTVDDDLVETLHVAHLFPPRAFVLGERKADFVAGRETLGSDRLPIVTTDEAGVWILVPEGADGELVREGQSRLLESLDATGELAPSGDAPNARRVLLAPGTSASITLAGGLTYQVRRVTRPKSLAAFRKGSIDARAVAAGAVSLLLNAGLVTAVLLLGILPPVAPPSAPLAEIRPARIVPRMPEPEEAVTRTQVRSFEGERHRGAEGRAGRPDAPEARRRLGIQGTNRVRTPARVTEPPPPAPPTATPPPLVVTPPTPAPVVARPSPLPPSPIPTPPARVANMPNWPTSSVATSTVATGPDPRSAQGNLTGAQIGDSRGAGGLGLRGTGPGGGGTGTGIGGGRVDMGQWGMDVGVSPVAREQVRRVIRSHTSQIRACYGGGGAGRVTLRLVVNQSGAVQAVRAQGGGAGDACAEQAVRSWSFPAIPNSGITIVTYPISLSGQDA